MYKAGGSSNMELRRLSFSIAYPFIVLGRLPRSLCFSAAPFFRILFGPAEKVLSLMSCCTPEFYGVRRAVVVAGQAAGAFASVHPLRRLSAWQGDVASGAGRCAFAASDASVAVYGKTAVGHHHTVEKLPNYIRQDERRRTFYCFAKATLAVLDGHGNFGHCIARGSHLCSLNVRRIGVHEWEGHVGVGHGY